MYFLMFIRTAFETEFLNNNVTLSLYGDISRSLGLRYDIRKLQRFQNSSGIMFCVLYMFDDYYISSDCILSEFGRREYDDIRTIGIRTSGIRTIG